MPWGFTPASQAQLGTVYMLATLLAHLHPLRMATSSEVSADGSEMSYRWALWRRSIFSTVTHVSQSYWLSLEQADRSLWPKPRPLEKSPEAKNQPVA